MYLAYLVPAYLCFQCILQRAWFCTVKIKKKKKIALDQAKKARKTLFHTMVMGRETGTQSSTSLKQGVERFLRAEEGGSSVICVC